ncbi:AMP-binding protein [Aeromicrobium sp. UC242_57]|uniref:AMP-binding protein n=1 Tax=Aeromicrobium sp. UC242_57 TaxID=3374624 RepID=UPI0037B21BBC
MKYPLTIKDYLYRAEEVFAARIGIVDEPDQPAEPWRPVSYAELGRLARSQAATLDELGVPVGGRVAIVSQNSARMLASFYGVSGFGRVLVPINFRLTPEEVSYIVEHSGAEVLIVDPSVRHLLDVVDVAHAFVMGEDQRVWSDPNAPVEWDGDAGCHGDHQLHVGHDRTPQGRPADTPQPVAQRGNLWLARPGQRR